MVEDRLKELGIELTLPPKPIGAYKPAVVSGNMIYVSGQLPMRAGQLLCRGKVGAEVSLEEAAEAARVAAINAIAALKAELGSLERVQRVVKVVGYVASAPGFVQQANVVNGASNLLFDVFGDRGVHARAAVGVFELPLGAPVEVELIAEISP
ncbi:MAG: RidA family protein [Deltaproteobacteria bacterium]